MSNYAATIVRISNLRKHSNADRLLCTNIFGNNIIVGLNTKEGDLGLYFPLESQIGLEFAEANDLIRRKDPVTGKPAGGMFDQNRRVRCQTFRGEKSMGFWIPMNEALCKLEQVYNDGKVLLNTWAEGDEIEKLGDFVISQKYIPTRTRQSGSGAKKDGRKPRVSKIIDGQFRFHTDTAQLGKNIHRIKPNDLVAITWKLHGTSAIAGNVLCRQRLSVVDKIAKFFGANIDETAYEMMYASRRVVKNEFMEDKVHFYGEDLWTRVGRENFEGKLHAGETVYYEIVGYTGDGSFIQKGFDYGCQPGQNKVYVYKITHTALDGSVVKLQWSQIKERCKELGVDHVPEIYYGIADLFPQDVSNEGEDGSLEMWQSWYLEHLKKSYVYDQDCQFCQSKVPSEGIVVLKEGLDSEAFKLKNFRFLEYETKELDKGELDMETAEATAEDQYLVNV